MSDALPLPQRPSLEQYKKLAKDFQRACKSGDAAIAAWAAAWVERTGSGDATLLPLVWRKLQKSKGGAAPCTLTAAQFFLARLHGFSNWTKFAAHVEAMARANSPNATFEAAVEAIVAGDETALQQLLADHPELVNARSARDHRSTLLHYVSANGVEDFRQKTPPNIVAIARMLLDAGAGVNAESDAYGGRSTTLGLAATSCHPEDAGVQIPLLELLIERGAAIDPPQGGSTVTGCLHNGRHEAAEYLAGRGARLDFEGAAGVGRLDIVQRLWPATADDLKNGLAWASEFGRTAVVEYLLRQGMAIDTRLPHHGQTALHWAAYGGHADTVKLLLERGTPVETRDESFDGTPLQWALYQWGNSPYAASRGAYYDTVILLVQAGAKLGREWFEEDDEERRRAVKKLSGDPRMQAALRGEL